MSESVPPLDLSSDHWVIVRNILKNHVPGQKVLAFGSRATRTARNYSDLDLVILNDKPLPLHIISALGEGFGESDLPFKVDLIEWARIDDDFRKIILAHGVTVQALEDNNIKTDERQTPNSE